MLPHYLPRHSVIAHESMKATLQIAYYDTPSFYSTVTMLAVVDGR